MVASYIPAPPPKDVIAARKIINQALDNMSYDELRTLAVRIAKAGTEVLLNNATISGNSLNDSGCPFV